MNVRKLLDRIDDLGIELELVGDRIRYRGTRTALAPELLAQLREHRDELVSVLQHRARLRWPPVDDLRGAADGDRIGPLTGSQQTLWAANQLADDGTYNLCGALRLRGDLATNPFVAALGDLQQRHPSLRTVFPVVNGEPLQRVLTQVPPQLIRRDLRGRSGAFNACLQECAALVDQRLSLDGDLPAVRMQLYQLAADDHVFCVVLHHVLGDGVSFRILIDDLVDCYHARREGRPPPPRAHTIDMIDVACWERDRLRYGNLAEARRYWREALDGCTAGLLRLPAPATAVEAGRGAAHQVWVDAWLTARIHEVAESVRATPFMVVVAAAGVVLGQLAGCDDFPVGMPVARRDREGMRDLVGLLLDTVPVRLDLRDPPSFVDVVRRTRNAVLGALTHPYVPPGGQLPAADRAGRRLFNVLMTDAGGELPPPAFRDLVASEVEVPQVGAKFDLNLLVRQAGEQLRLDIEYDRRAVGDELVAAIGAEVVSTLARAVADPRQTAAALLPASTVGASASAETRPANPQAVATLRKLAREVLELEEPQEVDPAADFFDLGGDSMRAIRLVSLAQEHGLTLSLRDVYDAPVLADLANRVSFAEPGEGGEATVPAAQPGVGTGRVPFSLLPVAASFRPEIEDAYPMTALQVGMLYHQELAPNSRVYHNLLSVRVAGRIEPAAFRAAVQAVAARQPILRTSVDLGHTAGPIQLVHRAVEVPVRFEDLSGRTAADQASRIHEVLEQERTTDFDLSYPPLLRFVVLTLSTEEYQLVFSHHHILLDGWSVNVLFDEIHTAYRMLLDGDPDPTLPPLRSSMADYVAREQAALADPAEEEFWLRRATTGGSLLAPGEAANPAMRRMSMDFPAGTLDDLRRAASEVGVPPKALLLAVYVRVLGWLAGQDEVVTGLVLTCRPDGPDADRVLGLFLNELPMVTSVGDPTWAELARQVHQEELTMLEHRWYPHAAVRSRRGDGPLFDSYFNFTDFHTTKRLLRDQDLDLLDALELEFTHYALGVNYTVDLRSHELRLILEYDEARLPRSTVLLAAEASRRAVRAVTADPRAPCRRVSFPGPLELARLSGGEAAGSRPDREERLDDAVPPATVDTAPGGSVATALEDSVRRVWAEVLGPGDYPADRSFFDIGGDSLTAMQVVSRLRARHGPFTIRAFAAAPTIAATARTLAAGADPSAHGGPPPRAAPRSVEPRQYPVSAAQRQMWSLATRLPQLPLFGIPGAFRIQGPLIPALLEQAFAAVVARHDALRTRFMATGDEVVQVVEPQATLSIPLVDLSGLSDPDTESATRMAAAAREPFALERAPLMRVIVYRLAPDNHVVHLSVHHIVCDGWSMALLQREVAEIYRGLVDGLSPKLAKPVSCGELIRSQLAWVDSPAAQAQRRYWLEQLAPPWPALSGPPGSRFRPAEGSTPLDRFRSRSVRGQLPEAAVQAVRTTAGATGLTEFMLILAGFAATLAGWSGQPDIRVATMLANRGAPGAEQAIGLLANTAVLRLRVDPASDPGSLAEHARHVCLEAYDNQELPFEEVLAGLERAYPQRPRQPLFEAMLLMQEELTGMEVGELRLTPFRPEHAILASTIAPTTIDLVLAATSGPTGITLQLQYKPTALTDGAARELVGDLITRLADIAQALCERR